MDTDNKEIAIIEEYRTFCTDVFDKLYKAFWKNLPEIKDKIELTKQTIDLNNDILSEETSEKALMLVKYLSNQHGATNKWDDVQFKAYKKAIKNGTEMELLDAEGTNIKFLAFIYAIESVTQNIENIYANLKEGKGCVEGNLFIIDGIRNPLFTENVADFEDIKSTCYKQLIDTLENKINSPFADKKLLIETEIIEFSRLFSPYESSKGWGYLTERLFCKSADEMAELYLYRMNIINGTYIHSFLEEDNEQRILCGKLFAIKEYVKYLKQLLLTKDSTAESKNVLLPDLLKNSSDIEIINGWLVDNEFIELGDEKNKCPYIWIGINRNEDLGIESEINSHSLETSEKKKPRNFSPIYQIAALGYWLFEKNKLNFKTYVASKIADAILTYYNFEKSDSNIKAFTKSNKDNLDLYSQYFDELRSVLKKPI